MKYEITCCKLFLENQCENRGYFLDIYYGILYSFSIIYTNESSEIRNRYRIPITWILLLIPSKSKYLGYTLQASIVCIYCRLCLRYIHVSSTSACQEIHMPYCRKSSLVYLWILHEQKACLTTAVRWRFLQGYIHMYIWVRSSRSLWLKRF